MTAFRLLMPVPRRLLVDWRFRSFSLVCGSLWQLPSTSLFCCWKSAFARISDARNSIPMRAYRTEITTMGIMKKQKVEPAKASCSRFLTEHSAESGTALPSKLRSTMPNWMAIGTAHRAPMTQTQTVILTARDSLDMVCALIGWQMAKYLSVVKQVIVSMEALVDISEVNPRRMQNASPKM